MKFWTTDHISNDNKIFMLFEEDPNPRVGHNKDIFFSGHFISQSSWGRCILGSC